MLRSLRDFERYTVTASDGDVGRVVDLLFDDERWTIRHLVADAGFTEARRVLISPLSFRQADWSPRRFHLALTTAKVAKSPEVDADRPVSRQHEREYLRHHGSPNYWSYPGLWGMGAYPGPLAEEEWTEVPAGAEGSGETSGDDHLRSANEVRGYHVQGSDGAIGHIEDFIVDDETWEVRYLVIDTSSWWVGKFVLVPPQWARSVTWQEKSVCVDMSRHAIGSSPEWDPTAGINREYEAHLYDYYGRPVYWESDDRPVETRPRRHRG